MIISIAELILARPSVSHPPARDPPAPVSPAREFSASDSTARDSPTRLSNERFLTGNHVDHPVSDDESDTESEEESEFDQLLRLARLQGLHNAPRQSNNRKLMFRHEHIPKPGSSLANAAGRSSIE